MLVAQVAVFLQTLRDDSFQFGRYIGIDSYRGNRSPIKDGLEDHSRAFPSERYLPSRHFIEHGSEREQVGSSVQLLSTDLLRRHVGDGSEHTAGTRQMFLRFDSRGTHSNALRLERYLCQSEVQNLRLHSARDENVRRLDIAVNDSFGVCRV